MSERKQKTLKDICQLKDRAEAEEQVGRQAFLWVTEK
jgi:hypothetical protein